MTTKTDESVEHADEDARLNPETDLRPPEALVPEREETVVAVVREDLDVEKRRVETEAGVRVRKTVQEREVVVDEPLEKDEVQVERIRVGRPIDGPLDVRYEGDTMIIPVVEEVLVVERRLMLQEEIHVTRRHRQVRSPQRVILRSEQASVERIESGEELAPATSAQAACAPLAEAHVAGDDDSLIERRRRQTELRRGRVASETTEGRDPG